MLFNKMVDYEAPFEIVKNEEGAWIPLEQSLLLLNSSMLIVDNVLIIDMPEKNIIDIYMDILKNNSTLLFDWNSDFGYTDWDWKVIGSASHVVNMFNGLLKKDGDTWVQFVQMFAMNTSSYDSKYGEAIAELFCTYSDEELSQEVQKMKKVMGYFDTSGTVGKTLKTLEKSVPSDADIKTLQETCNQLREKIDGSSTSIAAYNRAYQALENATDEATLFADSLAGSILEVEKNVSSATGFMDKVFKIAEVVGYAKEFQNQDKFAVEALDEYISNSDSQSLMSKAMKSGISDYITILKTDIVSYSALKYLNENYDSLITEATDLSSALGTQANLELIAWDLIQSANILNIGDKIKAADEFELALYSSVFQGDAFVSYQSIRDSVFSDVSNVTPEKLYSVSQYCYTYLKSCYITRNAAVASLKGKTKDVQEQIQPLIDYENGINETIAKYLVCLKDADRTNEKLCYGFLPEDNKEYLKNYNNSKLCEMCKNMDSVFDVMDYCSDWREIVTILDMEQEPKENGVDENYVIRDFSINFIWGESVELRNDGYQDISISGVILGEEKKDAKTKLANDLWMCNYSGEDCDCFLTKRNEKYYYLWLYSQGNVVNSWYLANWNDGEFVSEICVGYDAFVSISEEWKKAYIQFIVENGMIYDGMRDSFKEWYKLVDINGDDIPELYINFNSTADGDVLCSYYDDMVVYQWMWNYGFSYIEGQNLFMDSGGNMDEYYNKVYSIDDGEFVLRYDGEAGASDNANVQVDSEGYPVYNYYWNGTQVLSEEEYQKLLNDVYDVNQASDFYNGDKYNYREILEAIINY